MMPSLAGPRSAASETLAEFVHSNPWAMISLHVGSPADEYLNWPEGRELERGFAVGQSVFFATSTDDDYLVTIEAYDRAASTEFEAPLVEEFELPLCSGPGVLYVRSGYSPQDVLVQRGFTSVSLLELPGSRLVIRLLSSRP